MDDRIGVLQLVEGFSLGGAEKKLLELVKCTDKERFRTVVCSLGMGDALRDEFEALGVPVLVLERKWRVDPTMPFRVARLMKEYDIDVVMSTLFYADVVAPLAGRLAGLKGVFSWETISHPKWLVWHRLHAYRWATRNTDWIISVSQATRDWLVDSRGVPPEKVMVIPYGVDLERYKPGDKRKYRTRIGVPEEAKVVGVTARLHEQKGHTYLVDIADELVKRHHDLHFVFVGDGPERPSLEAAIEAKGLSDRFHLLGFRDDVPEVLQTFDVKALPSLYEGLPNVILEAMSSGKPVVASNVDGSREAIESGDSGLLVPPKDRGALLNALDMVLSDAALAERLATGARQRVEKHFSLEGQVRQFEELYERYGRRDTGHDSNPQPEEEAAVA